MDENMLRNDLVECNVFKGYFVVSDMPLLAVSKNTLQKHVYVNNGVWHNECHIRYIPFHEQHLYQATKPEMV